MSYIHVYRFITAGDCQTRLTIVASCHWRKGRVTSVNKTMNTLIKGRYLKTNKAGLSHPTWIGWGAGCLVVVTVHSFMSYCFKFICMAVYWLLTFTATLIFTRYRLHIWCGNPLGQDLSGDIKVGHLVTLTFGPWMTTRSLCHVLVFLRDKV